MPLHTLITIRRELFFICVCQCVPSCSESPNYHTLVGNHHALTKRGAGRHMGSEDLTGKGRDPTLMASRLAGPFLLPGANPHPRVLPQSCARWLPATGAAPQRLSSRRARRCRGLRGEGCPEGSSGGGSQAGEPSCPRGRAAAGKRSHSPGPGSPAALRRGGGGRRSGRSLGAARGNRPPGKRPPGLPSPVGTLRLRAPPRPGLPRRGHAVLGSGRDPNAVATAGVLRRKGTGTAATT